MGVDITFSNVRSVTCPHCGTVVAAETIYSERSGGRVWYSILESIGYYIPYEKRTEENDWYGKDMVLTKEQAMAIREYITRNSVVNGREIRALIAEAVFDKNAVVINANW